MSAVRAGRDGGAQETPFQSAGEGGRGWGASAPGNGLGRGGCSASPGRAWSRLASQVVHRDLKPENILYANDKDDAPIKVADFGLARVVSGKEMMKTACGTPGYVAPEVLKNKVSADYLPILSAPPH